MIVKYEDTDRQPDRIRHFKDGSAGFDFPCHHMINAVKYTGDINIFIKCHNRKCRTDQHNRRYHDCFQTFHPFFLLLLRFVFHDKIRLSQILNLDFRIHFMNRLIYFRHRKHCQNFTVSGERIKRLLFQFLHHSGIAAVQCRHIFDLQILLFDCHILLCFYI